MQKHIILTLGRSGSNTLSDLLNQNPAILNYGEVLGDWNLIRKAQRTMGLYRDNDSAYLDALLSNKPLMRTANTIRTIGKLRKRKFAEIKRMDRLSTVGFKEFSTHFLRLGMNDYVRNARDVKVIGLERRNVLDRMISNEFLEQTGVVALKSGDARDTKKKLWIDPASVLEKLDTIDRENDDLRRMLDALPRQNVFRIDYEDFYSGEVRTLDIVRKAYAFLGVPDCVPRVRMRKILKRDPIAALENADAVRDVIAASRFATYLHEAPGKAVAPRRAAQQPVFEELMHA